MRIRNAISEDKEYIAELFLQENRHHNDLEPERINRLSKKTILPEGWFEEIIDSSMTYILVAESDGVISGLVMFTEKQTDDDLPAEKKWIHINEIVVDEKLRGRGIGGILLSKVEAYAAENGFESVRLEVWKSNSEAICFYKKNDYEVSKHIFSKKITDYKP